MTRLDFDVDFNFSLSGMISETIGTYFNDSIKKLIKNYLKDSMEKSFLPIINNTIDQELNNLPIFIPTSENIIIDYSFLKPPKLIGDLLVMNIRGSFLQKSEIDAYIEKDKNIDLFNITDRNIDVIERLGLIKLKPIESTQKGIRAQISPYTYNTLLLSLFNAKLLQYNYDIEDVAEMVPEVEGIKNILHPANILRNKLLSEFGPKKKGLMYVEVIEVPKIKSLHKQIYSDIKMRLNFLVERTPGKMEPFAIFDVDFHIELIGEIKENIIPDFQIKKFNVMSFRTVTLSKSLIIADAAIQFLINFKLTKIVEYVNINYLKGSSFKFPSIMGMNFNDSKMMMFDNYVEVELNITYEKTKKIIKKMKKKIFY